MLFALILVSALLGAPDHSSPPNAGDEWSGAVTPILPRLCVPADKPERVRCAGLPGTDLFLQGAEEGRSVSLGRTDGFFPPSPVPTTLSRSASWRMLGSRAVAAIVFYRLAEGDDGGIFAVVKVGSGERKGCLMALVPANPEVRAEAEQRATSLADEKAVGFRCGTDQTSIESDGGEGLARDVARRWLGVP